jgi:hypothetical protein
VERHARQAKLREVGSAGQARIAQARVAVGVEGLAADIAARYLAGAGVAVVWVRAGPFAEGARAIAPGLLVEVNPALPADREASTFDLRDATCRDLIRGAHAALRALRTALTKGASPSKED